jgi:hypothetical protein
MGTTTSISQGSGPFCRHRDPLCVITGLGPVTHDFPLVKQRHGWPNKAGQARAE